MIVTIHQPEHFPYLGFFQKMSYADVFVILDNVKFKKNDFQNRNRFINRSGNEEWFTVPVEKNANSKLISEVVTANVVGWRKSISKQIQQNLGHSVEKIYEHDRLIDINIASIEWCMQKLGIQKKIVYASDLSCEGSKSLLLLNICQKLGATKYISGSGGAAYLDLEPFQSANIDVEFFRPNVDNSMSTLYNIKSK